MPGIHEAAKAAGIKDEQAQSLFAAIMDQVNGGETITVRNFGSFKAATRAARVITSPQIPGGRAEIPERRVLKFTAAPATKLALNGGESEPAGEGEPEAKAQEEAEQPAETKPAPKAAPAKAATKPAPQGGAKKGASSK